jgi:predicted XRE-type DNA-binding protein
LPPLADFTDVLVNTRSRPGSWRDIEAAGRLHAFEKKTPKTSAQDLRIGRDRFRALKSLGLLTQAEAATLLRVTLPGVSDLLHGRIVLFSTDASIDMLARVGVGVRLVLNAAG